ncbi:hypothetical protein QO002_005714 [Pararhizobium capsulatum DSM 1112]|uniref:Uncharacterized protein n=1 Tax=Pararhizobium capsulatum DSM 1112 TaxID=1121113 RepID=A0ABU0BZ05_9HYPH|nr:hypothetical protein [Pararhizobium capsulatum DSM 1112]
MEYIVPNPKFSTLFTEEIRLRAQSNLAQFGR